MLPASKSVRARLRNRSSVEEYEGSSSGPLLRLPSFEAFKRWRLGLRVPPRVRKVSSSSSSFREYRWDIPFAALRPAPVPLMACEFDSPPPFECVLFRRLIALLPLSLVCCCCGGSGGRFDISLGKGFLQGSAWYERWVIKAGGGPFAVAMPWLLREAGALLFAGERASMPDDPG